MKKIIEAIKVWAYIAVYCHVIKMVATGDSGAIFILIVLTVYATYWTIERHVGF